MTRVQTVVLAVAALAFAGAGQALAYATLVAPKKQAAAELDAMAQALRADRAAATAADTASAEAAVAGLDATALRNLSIPQLLSQVQEIALNVNVRITDLAPVEPGSRLLRVAMTGAYPDLVRFLARFEALPLHIDELHMDSSTEDGQPRASGDLTLSLVFQQIAGAPAHSFADAAAFEAALRGEALRNPFTTWNGAVAWTPERGSGDLTWIHHLTGISEIGDVRIATIDDHDYRVGDRIDGRTVTAIGEDAVTLTRAGPDGEQVFRLGFRYVLGARN